MAEDKTVNSTLNIQSLLSDDFFYVGRPSTNEDCYINAVDLRASILNGTVNNLTCIYNQDTLLRLCTNGDALDNTFKSVVLDCLFERNGKVRKQMVEVCYISSSAEILEHPIVTIPSTETDLGITLSVSVDDGVNLVISVDAVAINVNFYYNIVSLISI